MITEFNQLSNRYLKANKKRTILTIIGIVLSVALICSIGLFLKSLQHTEIEEAKGKYGSFHVAYTNINDELLVKITKNPKVGKSGLYSVGEEIQISDKLTIREVLASDKALEISPFKAAEGRLPQKENEIAIEKWAVKYINENAKVGEIIKIKNKEYELVGLLHNSIENQSNNLSTVLFNDNNIKLENATLIVEINSKTNLKKAVSELVAIGEKGNVIKNDTLLGLQGAGESGSDFQGLYFTVGIIVLIVVICTIAVIYNSFQISVVERVKQFGLLRAVGATPKQIRKLVFKEATIVALISIPIGLLFGIVAILGIKLMFNIIGADSVIDLKIYISYVILGIGAVVGVIFIYISALLPARFAGKISPLVAISSRATITKEKIKKRKSGIAGNIFGFEGALASKNMKRNRRRYRITVFSIVISVVLFITFKSFMDMSMNVTDDLSESQDIHFSIIRDYGSVEEASIDDKLIEEIESLSVVDKVYEEFDTNYFNSAISKEKEIKEIQDIGDIYKPTNLGNEKTGLDSSMVIYDDDALEAAKKYLQSGTIDIENMNKENGVLLIKENRILNGKTKNIYYGPSADLRVGDEVEVQYYDPAEIEDDAISTINFDNNNLKKVKIIGILESEPFNFMGRQDALKFISTKEVIEGLVGKGEHKTTSLNIKIKDINQELQAKVQIEEKIKGNPELTIINNIDENRKSKSIILMIQILLYGFVVVVSLIGSVNIVNTLTTNIILRKKEFSTLKSIGLTQRGLKKIIVLEGLLYGIVGTIYGSIIGTVLSFLMSTGINEVREFSWNIPWDSIGIAGVAALVIGYLSVLAPLKRIGKENLIESIREDF
ncbi:FtsX-like permease family protein [Clostridium sp.]|uniref:ABC transporter permease n=1 Tax=Clostridium sp. TaxID=1506 RepID=UPI002FC6FD6F